MEGKEAIEIGLWESLRQALGDLYAGREVQKGLQAHVGGNRPRSIFEYNAMFGVHKGWQEQADGSWLRTLRLIINLIPSNQVQSRVPGQPSAHMGYSPIWGQIALLEDEVILCYAEDARHCFHIFSPSPKWRGYFVMGKVAASSCFNDGRGSQHSWPRVKSAPMGWSNIVDFIQSFLERFGSLGIPAERVVRMGEPGPLMPLSTPRDYRSFYVDNYDGFKVVAACDMGIYEGRPSDAQLGVERWPGDPKKAAEGTLAWSSLGAEQLGDHGLVGGQSLGPLCAEPGEPRASQGHRSCQWWERQCTRCSFAGRWHAFSTSSTAR